MSPSGAWLFGSLAEDIGDAASENSGSTWSTSQSVVSAGRELSGWLGLGLSAPVLPALPVTSPSPTRNSSSRLASIHSLSRELLQVIFEFYVHAYPRLGADTPQLLSPLARRGSYRCVNVNIMADTSPVLLTHVCSLWKAVAVSTPSLWDTVCARLFRPQDMELFELWVCRSSQRPLKLDIFPGNPNSSTNFTQESNVQALSILLAQSDRWKTVRITLYQDTEATICDFSSLSLPLLQRLELDLVGYSPGASFHIFRLLSAAPNLTHVGWRKFCDLHSALPGVDWTGLTSVVFESISLTDLLPHLPQMRGLRSLSIRYYQGPHSGQPIFTKPTALPRLTALAVQDYVEVGSLLNCLSVPSLSSLFLYSGLGPGPCPDQALGWEAFYDFIKRLGYSIESMDFSRCDNPGWDQGFFTEKFSASSCSIFPQRLPLMYGTLTTDSTAQASSSSDTREIRAQLLDADFCIAAPAGLFELMRSWSRLQLKRTTCLGEHDRRLCTYSSTSADPSSPDQSCSLWHHRHT